NTKTVSLIVSRLTAMAAGFNKDFTAKQSLPVEGTTMLQPAILSQVATYLGIVNDAENARTALASKVAAKKAAMPDITKFLAALETSLKSAFGSGSPELQDFGIAPPKTKKQPSAQTKAVATANAKATKAARGIIGKNARSKITTTGTPGIVITDAQGNVVPGLSTGPIPPGAKAPVPVAAVSVGGGTPTPEASAQPASSPSAAPATPGSVSAPTPAAGSSAPSTTGSGG
ncbi:MAG TPA: hypothetical protein VMB50_07385, partial [Myxococcales bacterium]|nr:hypothetical protein [Myxococcales bacterium]